MLALAIKLKCPKTHRAIGMKNVDLEYVLVVNTIAIFIKYPCTIHMKRLTTSLSLHI